MKMPFGKYKGTDIDDLSLGYIETLLKFQDIKSKKLLDILNSRVNQLRAARCAAKSYSEEEYYYYMGYEYDDYSDLIPNS